MYLNLPADSTLYAMTSGTNLVNLVKKQIATMLHSCGVDVWDKF
jgi:hypothetical protein